MPCLKLWFCDKRQALAKVLISPYRAPTRAQLPHHRSGCVLVQAKHAREQGYGVKEESQADIEADLDE